MTPETFIQNFGHLAGTSGAVKRLRELILQLAVQGKLVPQDPSDEPASTLLKKIAAEKARLVKEGKIRKPKPLPPIKPEDVPFELPEMWEWVRLANVSILEMGQSPKGEFTNENGIGVPLIGDASDLGSTMPLAKKHTESTTKLCKRGDIILCVRATIGKINFADKEYCLGRGVAGLRPIIINKFWFARFIEEQAAEIDAAGTGSTFRQVDLCTVQNN